MQKNILLWGTGQRALKYISKNYFSEHKIIGFIDTYSKKEKFLHYNVYKPEELYGMRDRFDYLVITTQYFFEIIELCWKYNVDLQKIVITDCVEEPFFSPLFRRLRVLDETLYNSCLRNRLKLIKINESDRYNDKCLVGNGNYNKRIYLEDYFRYRTFEFVADELIKNGVKGEVAEFGVFRGYFSALINEKFSDRKLFLFDTFEGFNPVEARKELEMNRCDVDFILGHAETSVELMLRNMPHQEKCILCRGLFPASLTEEAYKSVFAFVSIDVDFEESTYEGLKFFYPRLSDGGVIFLHDYHSAFLRGVEKAVKDYEKDYNLSMKKIPLADRAGTLVIIKGGVECYIWMKMSCQ